VLTWAGADAVEENPESDVVEGTAVGARLVTVEDEREIVELERCEVWEALCDVKVDKGALEVV
jgi:ectoine hydroxylase-related dioxygenase (phytanoyl-CoA dioxygenase family)